MFFLLQTEEIVMVKDETRNFIHVLYYVAQAAAEEESQACLSRFHCSKARVGDRICMNVSDIIGFEELKKLNSYITEKSSQSRYSIEYLLNELYNAAKNYDPATGFEEIETIIGVLAQEGFVLHFKPELYVHICNAMS